MNPLVTVKLFTCRKLVSATPHWLWKIYFFLTPYHSIYPGFTPVQYSVQFFYFVNAGCLVPIENSLFVDKKQTDGCAWSRPWRGRGGAGLFFLLIKLSSSSSSSFERAIIFFLGRLQHGKPPNSSPPYMRQPPYSVRNNCFMREIGQHDWQSSTTSLAPSRATAHRSHHLSIQIHIIQKWCFQPQNLSFAPLN